MDDPNITMEEYIRLEEEKARRRGKVYNWETATYGKIWYDEDVHDLRSVETKFPAIAFNEKTLSCEPTVSPLNDKIDFRISFDESDDEDYTPTIRCFDDLDFLKDFENEFPAIVYNDALTSKSDFLTEPTEARRAAEKAYDVAKVDERVNKAVAVANRSTNAARVVAVLIHVIENFALVAKYPSGQILAQFHYCFTSGVIKSATDFHTAASSQLSSGKAMEYSVSYKVMIMVVVVAHGGYAGVDGHDSGDHGRRQRGGSRGNVVIKKYQSVPSRAKLSGSAPGGDGRLGKCWSITKAQANRVEVAELRMLRWTCGKTMVDMIPNGVFRAKLDVDFIIDKMREGRLRWFGYVKRRPQTAPVRRVEALLVNGSMRRGRPKLKWEDRLKQDMKKLLLSEDMTFDRNT
ncbi:hypothetical protein Tco_1121540 [Tanacetum coccineum]|uniref:Uncharacterized protein n=1 Tax=Tanacetum coccineum TaxID=301880 RepID=A0ABQ5IZC9_9ASTR